MIPATAKNIMAARKRVKDARNGWWLDRFLLWAFPGVFLRWCDGHLQNAKYLSSEDVHSLDAQMKGDLGLDGY